MDEKLKAILSVIEQMKKDSEKEANTKILEDAFGVDKEYIDNLKDSSKSFKSKVKNIYKNKYNEICVLFETDREIKIDIFLKERFSWDNITGISKNWLIKKIKLMIDNGLELEYEKVKKETIDGRIFYYFDLSLKSKDFLYKELKNIYKEEYKKSA